MSTPRRAALAIAAVTTLTMPAAGAVAVASASAPHGGSAVAKAPAHCRRGQLHIRAGGGEGAAGNEGLAIVMRNSSGHACTLYGYAGLQRLKTSGHKVRTHVSRGGGMIYRDPGPALITVQPGRAASFGIDYSDVTVGHQKRCPESQRLEVTPPNDYKATTIEADLYSCTGDLAVTAVQAGRTPAHQR